MESAFPGQASAAFTPEYLASLRFKEGPRAVAHLKSLAEQAGFKLSSRDAITSDVIRLYCHRSPQSKGHKNSTKTNCAFQIKLRRRATEKVFLVMPSSVLIHDHELLPPLMSFLPREVEDAARAMLQVGIGKREVTAVIHQMIGQPPTREQLITLMQDDQITPMATETELLIAQIAEDGGESYTFLMGGERAAVLTITALEKENLTRFGDVLFLDGTMIRNSLGWTTLPVTLINEAKQITSGGLLFTAFENQEIFDWFLGILADISDAKLRTVMTDEDPALVAAADNLTSLRPGIAHRLCTFHKRRNLQQKVQRTSKDPAIQAEALTLFRTIIYSKRRSSVAQALAQLKTLLPTLVDYIEIEIEALLPKLAEAFREGALTLGSSTTSVSESCNRMLKSGPILPTFVGIRNAHTRSQMIKSAVAQARTGNRFKRAHFLKTLFGLELSVAIQQQIDTNVAKAAKWTVRPEEDDPGYWQAHSKHSVWRLHYDGTIIPECECNEVTGTGLPCCHMIALFHQYGGPDCFPVQVIAERWFVKSPEVELPPLPLLRLEESDEIQCALSARSSDDGDDSNEEDDEDERIDGRASSDDEELEPEVRMAQSRVGQETQRQRYSRLITVAKEIARKAAVSQEQSENVMDRLQTILASLLTSLDGEVRDITGRPRGRPRKKGHSRPDRSITMHCALCDSESHNLWDCDHYSIFREEQTNFTVSSGGKRHCALCHHPGHRRDGCPVLDIARRRLREEPRSTRRKRA